MSEQLMTPIKNRIANIKVNNLFSGDSRVLWTVLALILILVVNRLISPNFFTIRMVNGRLTGSLINILDGASPIMLLAIGMTLVIATKGVDLSVGAVMAISAAVAVVFIRRYENGADEIIYKPLFVILITLGVGALCGLWNGVLVAILDIQPIIATLILMVAGRGVAQMITKGQSPTFTNETLAYIGRGVLLGVPFPVYLSLIVFLVVYLLVRWTAIGMLIESVGVNARASYYTGINATLIKLFVYVLSGMCAAMAGMIVAGEVKSADPHKAGEWSELDAILAVSIGGTLLSGGRFNLGLSVVGALIIQSLLTGLYVSKLHPTANLVVKAIVVLLVLLLQSKEFRQYITQPVRRKT
ncbi:MAG: ABC transporter permease [Anaerolineae bacterium]|nr:MAG: ABC transporter permease [Anaerolineae bacterium]MCL4879694.1 ABC transporter permease [Anaerolineae bacterium]